MIKYKKPVVETSPRLIFSKTKHVKKDVPTNLSRALPPKEHENANKISNVRTQTNPSKKDVEFKPAHRMGAAIIHLQQKRLRTLCQQQCQDSDMNVKSSHRAPRTKSRICRCCNTTSDATFKSQAAANNSAGKSFNCRKTRNDANEFSTAVSPYSSQTPTCNWYLRIPSRTASAGSTVFLRGRAG